MIYNRNGNEIELLETGNHFIIN